MASQAPLIIVGGGLAGSLAALMLAERRPELPLLLLEAGETFGGNHTWSFFDSDVPRTATALVAALQPVIWPRHVVRFITRERVLPFGYNSVCAPSLDALVRSRLGPHAARLDVAVQQLEADGVILSSGQRIAASGVIDARGPDRETSGLELGWQKFVGIEFACAASEPDCATVMDATVPQLDGYRFVYVLPLAADRVLVEDTYYSNGPELDVALIADRVRHLARERGLAGKELRQETGVLPILIGGDPGAFWPANDPIARLGLRGGFFHATTGYSFGLALQQAEALAAFAGPFDSHTLARLTRARFLEHWRRTGFFRLLNRLMFHAADPAQRHRIFAHFYRLPPQVIQRFYAGRPTIADRIRILSGRPPVPLSTALTVLLRLHKGGRT